MWSGQEKMVWKHLKCLRSRHLVSFICAIRSNPLHKNAQSPYFCKDKKTIRDGIDLMSLHKISQERMGPPQNMPSLWQKYSSIVARWVWWMACLPNPWSVSRWPSVSLSSNLQVSEAGAIHPYPSGATRGVSATNTLFQSVLHSTLLAGTVQITLLLWFLPRTAQGIWARGSCS